MIRTHFPATVHTFSDYYYIFLLLYFSPLREVNKLSRRFALVPPIYTYFLPLHIFLAPLITHFLHYYSLSLPGNKFSSYLDLVRFIFSISFYFLTFTPREETNTRNKNEIPATRSSLKFVSLNMSRDVGEVPWHSLLFIYISVVHLFVTTGKYIIWACTVDASCLYISTCSSLNFLYCKCMNS